jgi:hypothetical protein
MEACRACFGFVPDFWWEAIFAALRFAALRFFGESVILLRTSLQPCETYKSSYNKSEH